MKRQSPRDLGGLAKCCYIAPIRKPLPVGEIRPWRGLIVTVGRFRARKDLVILDLSTRLSRPNPLTTEQLGYELEMMRLMERLRGRLELAVGTTR